MIHLYQSLIHRFRTLKKKLQSSLKKNFNPHISKKNNLTNKQYSEILFNLETIEPELFYEPEKIPN